MLGADLRPASSELVKKIQAAIDPPPGQGLGLGMAPIGAQVTISAPTTVQINISARLVLQHGHEIGQVQEPAEAALKASLETTFPALVLRMRLTFIFRESLRPS